MSRNKPVHITLKEDITVVPNFAFRSKVVKSGNGAVIPSFKKFVGKKCIVIIDDGTWNTEDMESASPEGWQKTGEN